PGSREEALSPGALPGPRRGAGARGPGAQAYARPPLASPPPRMVLGALLLLAPRSLALAYVVHASALWVFATSVLAIVPLAEWIRRATEQTARLAGPTIGGLLNVTFGNMAELILALFVLSAGHAEVVKAQITGSIVGNSLLGLGLGIVAGSWGRDKQTFSRQHAGLLSSLLILSVIALMLPALFDYPARCAPLLAADGCPRSASASPSWPWWAKPPSTSPPSTSRAGTRWAWW